MTLTDSDNGMDLTGDENFELPSLHSNLPFGSQREVTNMILNLKDKHKLTQTALDDVVDTTASDCEFIKRKVKCEIEDLACDLQVESTSPFVVGVISVLDKIKSPLHDLQSSYKQKTTSAAHVLMW